MNLSNISFKVKSGDYFVDIDRGYIGYGKGNNYQVERIAHFIDWKDVPSRKWLHQWANDFLANLPVLYE